jgi:hypothetical protein
VAAWLMEKKARGIPVETGSLEIARFRILW